MSGDGATTRTLESLASNGARFRRLEPILFACLLVCHLLPIWALAYFPTQDGPAHLENALALLRRSSVPLLQEYYELNRRLLPNWFGHGLMALLSGFSPPALAEKLLFSGYAAGLPLAFRYALPARARARGFSLALFPFLYGFSFHMGFANFCWSLVFYFLALGLWERSRGRLDLRRGIGFSALVLLIALSHPLSLLVFLLTLGCIAFWPVIRRFARGRSGARRSLLLRARCRIAAVAGLAALPGTALVAALALTGADGYRASWMPFKDRLVGLLLLSSLVTERFADILLSGLFSAAILIAVAAALWRRSKTPDACAGTLFAAVATAILALLAPDSVGSGWFITPRLQIFPFALALVWLGSRPGRTIIGYAVPAVSAVVAIALLALHLPGYIRLSRSLEEYTSVASQIAPGSVVLPLQLTSGRDAEDRSLPGGYRPFLHAGGYLAAERDSVDLTNYEASTNYFPLRYREDRNPYRILGSGPGIEGENSPPCVDLEAGGSKIRIDYVVLFGSLDAVRDDPCVRRWRPQLERGFERVFVSRPKGYAALWRARPSRSSLSGQTP